MFDALAKQGYVLVEVSGYSVDDKATYAGIWELRKGAVRTARHGLTPDQYQQEFDKLSGDGFRLVNIDGYTVGGKANYAAIWEKSPGPPQVARHGLSADEYQQEFDRLGREGYRLVDLSGYSIDGKDHYAAIWQKKKGPPWVARHGMISEKYQQEFNKFTQQGYRLASISGWNAGSVAHYAAVWEKVQGPAWAARHAMLSDAFQEEFDKFAKKGYRLKYISGYHTFD